MACVDRPSTPVNISLPEPTYLSALADGLYMPHSASTLLYLILGAVAVFSLLILSFCLGRCVCTKRQLSAQVPST